MADDEFGDGGGGCGGGGTPAGASHSPAVSAPAATVQAVTTRDPADVRGLGGEEVSSARELLADMDAYLAASEAWRRSRANVVYQLGDHLRSTERAAEADRRIKEDDEEADGCTSVGCTGPAGWRSLDSTNLHVDADVLRERLHAAAGRPAPAWSLPTSESKIDTMLDEMPSEAALRDETLKLQAAAIQVQRLAELGLLTELEHGEDSTAP